MRRSGKACALSTGDPRKQFHCADDTDPKTVSHASAPFLLASGGPPQGMGGVCVWLLFLGSGCQAECGLGGFFGGDIDVDFERLVRFGINLELPSAGWERRD